MAVSSANAGEKSKLWPVEKYARFVSSQQTSCSGGSTAKKSDGLWQHYSSKEGGIQLALVESNHLIISSGAMIFESFSLWDAQKWLKIVTRGDSAMFIYKVKNESRRFRVKFAPNSSSATALETCRQFSTVIAPLVPVKEMEVGAAACRKGTTRTTSDKTGSFSSGLDGDSQFLGCGEDFDSSQQQVVPETQSNTESRQPNMAAVSGPILIPDESSLIPIPDIGKLVQSQGKCLGRAYADTNLPTEQLGQFIRLCLTDANFPAFVESVERELNSMTNS